jgi:hypothetical protein
MTDDFLNVRYLGTAGTTVGPWTMSGTYDSYGFDCEQGTAPGQSAWCVWDAAADAVA